LTPGLKHHHVKKGNCTNTKSKHPYLLFLIKLHCFLAHRASAPFNKVILHGVFLLKANCPPISLSRILKQIAQASDASRAAGADVPPHTTIAIVGIVIDNVCLLAFPKLSIAMLCFTRSANSCIISVGGETLTDRLVLRAPTGLNTVLPHGKQNTHEAIKHFGML
jgi:large subunit ribosomal protein L18e